MVCALVAATTFTSCLDDDDDEKTRENALAAVANMTGVYKGKMTAHNAKEYTDTTEVTWTCDTSGIHILDFPVSTLADCMTGDSTLQAELRKMGTATMLVSFQLYQIGKTEYDFYTGPSMTFDVTYGGITRKLGVLFDPKGLGGNGYYTLGFYSTDSRSMSFSMAVTGLYEQVGTQQATVEGWNGYLYYMLTSSPKEY